MIKRTLAGFVFILLLTFVNTSSVLAQSPKLIQEESEATESAEVVEIATPHSGNRGNLRASGEDS
jgi:hypothetical protein